MSKILQRTVMPEGGVKESDLWRTPRLCYNALNQEFQFHVDLAASGNDHLHPTWWLGLSSSFGEPCAFVDALDRPWIDLFPGEGHRRGFLNPPYSSQIIGPFMEKAAYEASLGFLTVALVPDTPDTKWYRCTEWATEIRHIPHRVPYLKADGTTKAGAMFPSCVVVFRPQPGVRHGSPRHVTWSYR